MLSMTELLRPFVIYFLPILLWQVWLALKDSPKKYLWYFLIPLFLFSGLWHAKHLFMYGQVTWTNHSGFNLYQAWSDMAHMPELEPELPSTFETGPPNINSEVHGRNSRKISQEIMKAIWYRPGVAFVNILKQAGKLLKPETKIYEHDPQHFIFGPYRIAVWLR